jgi:hypothetical protein
LPTSLIISSSFSHVFRCKLPPAPTWSSPYGGVSPVSISNTGQAPRADGTAPRGWERRSLPAPFRGRRLVPREQGARGLWNRAADCQSLFILQAHPEHARGPPVSSWVTASSADRGGLGGVDLDNKATSLPVGRGLNTSVRPPARRRCAGCPHRSWEQSLRLSLPPSLC